MFAGPLVDDVHRLPVLEVACLRLSIVIGVCYVQEVGQEVAWLIEEDGIGEHHIRLLVECRQFGEHLAAEGVDAVGSCFAKAKGLTDFLTCHACCPVVEHSQGVGDA